MAELGTLISIAKNIYTLSQSEVINDIRGCKADLDKLNKTVSFIKNLLLDADTKPVFSHVEQAWVDELTEVLYEADDLFDELITAAELEKLNYGDAKSYKKVLNKVSRFFSYKNRILISYNISQEVKSIHQKLDAIALDHARYDFKVDSQATLKRKVETCSFLDKTHENIIGREDDVKDFIDMLLDPNVEENVGFVVIVGIGGLGKTTLARLVYNHDDVISRFDEKLWVCVSDQDEKKLDVQAILGNIIEASTKKKPSDISTMQSMQTKFQEELKGQQYLLILDDVWTEDPNEWSRLRRYLTIGGTGSRIVITTRSEKTAEVVLGRTAHSKMYMLKGLSDENSWRLFVSTAFKQESNETNDPELIEIGQKIVKKCSNVPLAIKVLGTLLYDQTHRWKSFEENRLPQIETTKNPIVSILKLSYNNLEPSVKSCFRYCALFPKDFVMEKRKLISLWMVQGYNGDCEDNFLVLLKRCFFQDVVKDYFGDVISFKMHDLIHDLAQEVAGDEFIVANSLPNNLTKKSRHLFIGDRNNWTFDGSRKWAKINFQNINIRTCYIETWVGLDIVTALVANWRFLRTLRLHVSYAYDLPEAIGELLHLRYLDLSENRNLRTLPNSIVKLYNLQSLILSQCCSLRKWPKYFYKLINLRLLDIRGCRVCMPLGIGKLTNLRGLADFRVESMGPTGKQLGGELRDLKLLVNLSGKLDIWIRENFTSEKEIAWEDSYLEPIKNLKAVAIHFEFDCKNDNGAPIANLQPNRNITQLKLEGFNGIKIPRWGRTQNDWAIILPNLVNIELCGCKRLAGIPLLSKLKHLKSLSLEQLNNLEYMDTNAISQDSYGSKDVPFFPSLNHLHFRGLERLKGWWVGVGGESDSSSGMPPFPRLSTLFITDCHQLTSFPPCPSLESLVVFHCNKSFRILPSEGSSNSNHTLRVEHIDSLGYLTTLPATRLSHIMICDDHEFEMTSEIEEVFKSSSSLRSLEIYGSNRPISVSGVLKHLTALEYLSLERIDGLVDDDIPWRSLRHNLHTLRLDSLYNLQILPRGVKHLTALQNLVVSRCDSLTGLPEWMSRLSSLHTLKTEDCSRLKSLGTIQNITSLQKLHIRGCPELREACKKPSGKEWLNIRHIPRIGIRRYEGDEEKNEDEDMNEDGDEDEDLIVIGR